MWQHLIGPHQLATVTNAHLRLLLCFAAQLMSPLNSPHLLTPPYSFCGSPQSDGFVTASFPLHTSLSVPPFLHPGGSPAAPESPLGPAYLKSIGKVGFSIQKYETQIIFCEGILSWSLMYSLFYQINLLFSKFLYKSSLTTISIINWKMGLKEYELMEGTPSILPGQIWVPIPRTCSVPFHYVPWGTSASSCSTIFHRESQAESYSTVDFGLSLLPSLGPLSTRALQQGSSSGPPTFQ